jgi:glycosyltransferase involved in cell wall biosynthesis
MAAPRIDPVPSAVARPLWSVMIPTFNCAQYLRQTLETVLAEDPGPDLMQIEVVDDCSTKDDPEAVVREVGKGRIAFYRKPQNEGAIANFNSCIQRSRGHLLHILHGDDYICPGFYRKVAEVARQFNQISLIASRCFCVDEEGVITAVSDRLQALELPSTDASIFFYGNPLRTPGVVVRRAFYESAGGFIPALIHSADCEMWARAVGQAGGVVIRDPLVCYRLFAQNDSGRLARTGENLRDVLRMGRYFERQFEAFDYGVLKRAVADAARRQAQNFLDKGDIVAYRANIGLWKETATPVMKLRRRGGQILKMARVR